MKLNALVLVAAVVYGIAGLAFTFAPAELLAGMGAAPSPAGTWLGQILGAALLGLAFLNWLQRYATVGGVLGRPLLLMNLVFVTVAFWSSVSAWRHQGGTVTLATGALLGALSIAFGIRLFGGQRPG